jgi:pimeloyl-ACP methyl ester carboxylesterase
MRPLKLIFLPGAGGHPDFWRPMSDTLRHIGEHVLLGWPGFGGIPAQADVTGMNDLVDMVVQQMDAPCALIAQSMGGVIAMKAALARPEAVTHLVLSVTSGGVPMDNLGSHDWRPDYFAANPDAPRWFGREREDLSEEIPGLDIPTLLLWGDRDPISPVAVGQRLHALLMSSQLHVVAGGEHDLAKRHAATLAPRVMQHLLLAKRQPLPTLQLFQRLHDMGAGEFKHLNGTLEAHLLGTEALLAAWGAPDHVRTAGLFHAAYGTDGFEAALVGMSHRQSIAELIGEKAERLVYLYCCCDRNLYYPLIGTPAAMQLPNRWLGTMEALSLQDVRDLSELTAANELEIAAQNKTFRQQHGVGLGELFRRMGTDLSPTAHRVARQVLGHA